jgi:hypothetical protein
LIEDAQRRTGETLIQALSKLSEDGRQLRIPCKTSFQAIQGFVETEWFCGNY